MTHDILFMTAVKRSAKLEIPIVSSTRHDNRLTYHEKGRVSGGDEERMKIQFTGNGDG